MATAVKGDPVQVFLNQQLNYQSPDVIDCRNANAVHIATFVAGTSPSATITVLGSNAAGGNYQTLPDSNAIQRLVAASASYEVNVGSAFARVEISDISGTYARGQGYTVYVTPYISAGSRQRPNWWDRNPIQQSCEDTRVAAPHGATTRATYTVPAGKLAFLEACGVQIVRRTAASSVGRAECQLLQLNPDSSRGIALYAVLLNNDLGAHHEVDMGQAGIMLPGAQISIVTEDASTGGLLDYSAFAKLVEFDA